MKPVDNFFSSKEELIAKAKSRAKTVPHTLQTTIIHHYVARYLVVLYEARYSEIPLQVWNEYRNCLDHFCRYVTFTSPQLLFKEPADQLSKMEGHMQRAILDISKIFCHRSEEYFEKQVDRWGDRGLITN